MTCLPFRPGIAGILGTLASRCGSHSMQQTVISAATATEPLGDGGVPEGKVHVRPGLPGLAVLCEEVQETLSPAGPVEGLGLRLQFRREGHQPETLGLVPKGDPLC